VSIGWYSTVLPQQKRVKPLGEYLKPEPTAEEKRAAGAAQVAAMLDRMARKAKTGEEPSP
jgi:hypothetical protein